MDGVERPKTRVLTGDDGPLLSGEAPLGALGPRGGALMGGFEGAKGTPAWRQGCGWT